MFNFNEERYLRIQGGAIEKKDHINNAIDEICASKGFDNLFLVASGGANILMFPAHFALRSQSTLPVFLENAAELVVTDSRNLTDRSLVVFASLSGTTTETVRAAEYVKGKGATTLSFVGHADTPLAKLTDYTFVNFAEDDTSCESFYIQFYLLALRLMNLRGEFPAYDQFVSELSGLPIALVHIKDSFEDRAAKLAAEWKDVPYHMFTGAGAVWGEAYYYAMCILEEMQWIRTRPVHAADFFHGAFELIENGVSVVLLKGEDATRPLANRVEDFAKNHTDRLTVLDSRDFDLPGISSEFRGLLSPVILAAALERVSAHLEHLRNHPLTTRRYYRRIPY
ncbi:MAG: SIS domain-containing protein [Alicyclobacillus sp.]|nr:SIS domain-containing protein [Alicyclobacillus sp.]